MLGDKYTKMSMEEISERLSGLSGCRIGPEELEKFYSPSGSAQEPVEIVPEKLCGYSENSHLYEAGFELSYNGKVLLGQAYDFLPGLEPEEVVRHALTQLLRLADNPKAGSCKGNVRYLPFLD
ncbi:MAG: hypothetical protein HY367_00055 [Candidatus Aenigmarchaeota archaeon]|nr:hypothetical protein [Candidatus Aenigmarchaeota archaeon]